VFAHIPVVTPVTAHPSTEISIADGSVTAVKPSARPDPRKGVPVSSSADTTAKHPGIAQLKASATDGAIIVSTPAASTQTNFSHAPGGPDSLTQGAGAAISSATATIADAPLKTFPATHASTSQVSTTLMENEPAAVPQGDTRTLVATPNVLEIGLTGGAHGWVRVRAEVGQAGEVQASLVASNAGAADALHKQLGDISAYLKNEAVAVSSLVVAAPERAYQSQGSATYEMPSGAGGAGAQAQGSRRDPEAPVGLVANVPDGGDWISLPPATSSSSGLSLAGISSGGWLNVVV
jgi:hypothetical protein